VADIDDQTITNGDTVSVSIEEFRDSASSGSADRVNMGSADFTIEFSDGSIIELTTPACP
jgi:hypothetical protein